MKPVQPTTDTKWEMYKRSKYYHYSKQTSKVPCTFEEAMEKAAREREMIDKNDKGYKWTGR